MHIIPTTQKSRVVLGVDPGFTASGFGVLKQEGNKSFLVEHGYLKMSSTKPLTERVSLFYDFFTDKVTKWQVTELALETPFLGKNAQNFLKLGYLRGLLYLIAHKSHLQLHEFSPREVKQSITGFGGASKEQVARVVLQLFPAMKMPDKLDVTDALAVTLCGLWHRPGLLRL